MMKMVERVKEALPIKRGTGQQRDLNKLKAFLVSKLKQAEPMAEIPSIPQYGVGNTFSDAPHSMEWGEICIEILEALIEDTWDWSDIDNGIMLYTLISHETKEEAFMEELLEELRNKQITEIPDDNSDIILRRI